MSAAAFEGDSRTRNIVYDCGEEVNKDYAEWFKQQVRSSHIASEMKRV